MSASPSRLEDGASGRPLIAILLRIEVVRRTSPYCPHVLRRLRLTLRTLGPVMSAECAENRMYIHELKDWPKLHWNSEALAGVLADVRHRQGRLLGQMQALGFGLREEAILRTLTEDVVKSSAIEGQDLDPAAVRSSIARRLGMDVGGLKPA